MDKLVASLDGRRSWPSHAVKVWLKNPNVVVTRRPPAGKPIVVHAWPANQNDYYVPMARINSGDTLYEVSAEEYQELEKLNENVSNRGAQPLR